MNTRTRMMLCLLGLLAAAHPGAAAPAEAARSVSATDVVQEYLADRTANDLTKAYALLSPATQQNIPFSQFTAHQDMPADSIGTPVLRTLFTLVINTSVTPGYDYHVQGADPGASVPRPGRHGEGSHFAFADGHVTQVPDKPADGASAPDFTP